jgi:uncharacterized membrane protein YuzA (DUF378 family)
MANTIHRESNLTALTWVAIILSAIGAFNWGLVGLFGFNLVAAIFGATSALTRIVYVLIGLAGIYLAVVGARLHETTRLKSG